MCYTDLNELPYVGVFGMTPERLGRSRAPFFTTEMAVDQQRLNAVDILVEEGYLEAKAVGVFWVDADSAVANDAVIPQLEAAGVNVVSVAGVPDAGGDQLASDQAIDVILERLRTDGVEALINVSNVVQLSQALTRTDYRPELYYLSDQVADADILRGSNIGPDTLEGAIGVATSQATLEELEVDEPFLRCIADYNAGEPAQPLLIGSIEPGVAFSVARACADFALLTMLLEAAGHDLTPDSLVSAADDLGTFDLAGLPGSSLGPGKQSAGNAMRIYEYDPDAFTFVAISEPIVVGGS